MQYVTRLVRSSKMKMMILAGQAMYSHVVVGNILAPLADSSLPPVPSNLTSQNKVSAMRSTERRILRTPFSKNLTPTRNHKELRRAAKGEGKINFLGKRVGKSWNFVEKHFHKKLIFAWVPFTKR